MVVLKNKVRNQTWDQAQIQLTDRTVSRLKVQTQSELMFVVRHRVSDPVSGEVCGWILDQM